MSAAQSPDRNPKNFPAKFEELKNLFDAASRRHSRKIGIRCLAVLGLSVLLLIPLAYFRGLVEERSDLYHSAIYSITGSWGGSQIVSGPALIIPYVHTWEEVSEYQGLQGKPETRVLVRKSDRQLVLLPKTVDFTARLATEIRYRGIYNTAVYTAPVHIQGLYRLPGDGPLHDPKNTVQWDKAFLSLGIADLRAISDIEPLRWNGREAGDYAPGNPAGNFLGSAFHTRVPLSPASREYSFSLNIKLNGSGGLYFSPVGEITTIAIDGDWPHPSFGGALLPHTRSIDRQGFSAEWSVPHLSRTYPQTGDPKEYALQDDSRISRFTAGVNLFEGVSLYRQIERAVKYGFLFIGLTFIALLGFELISRGHLHLIQYGLVGLALCLFYLVLLSLAEHLAFWQSFAAASALVAAMNGLYIAAALRSRRKGLLLAGLLLALYGVLYSLLQMEDYAILVGTTVVVFMIGALMFLTRNLGRLEPDAAAESGQDSAGAAIS